MKTKEVVKPEDLEAADRMGAEVEAKDEARRVDEQAVQQDLNQGMQTGTHDSTKSGIKWGPSYRKAKPGKPKRNL